MKHLKLYEDFQSENILDEGIIDAIKSVVKGITDKKEAAKAKALIEDYNARLKAWRIKPLSKDEFDTELEKAKADGFEGIWSPSKDKKSIVYKPAKDVKWGSAGGHTFGGGAGA